MSTPQGERTSWFLQPIITYCRSALGFDDGQLAQRLGVSPAIWDEFIKGELSLTYQAEVDLLDRIRPLFPDTKRLFFEIGRQSWDSVMTGWTGFKFKVTPLKMLLAGWADLENRHSSISSCRFRALGKSGERELALMHWHFHGMKPGQSISRPTVELIAGQIAGLMALRADRTDTVIRIITAPDFVRRGKVGQRPRVQAHKLTFWLDWPVELTFFRKLVAGPAYELEAYRLREKRYQAELQSVRAELHSVRQEQPVLPEPIMIAGPDGSAQEPSGRGPVAPQAPLIWNALTIQAAVNGSQHQLLYSIQSAGNHLYCFAVRYQEPYAGGSESRFGQALRTHLLYADDWDALFDKLIADLHNYSSSPFESAILFRFNPRHQYQYKSIRWNGIFRFKQSSSLEPLGKSNSAHYEAEGQAGGGDIILFNSGGDGLFEKIMTNRLQSNSVGQALSSWLSDAGPAGLLGIAMSVHPQWEDFSRLVKEGLVMKRSGQNDKALERLKKAYAIIPQFSKLLYLLARMYAEKKDYENVVRYLGEYIIQMPDDLAATYNVAVAMRIIGRISEAEEVARRLRRRDPANVDYLTLHLSLLARLHGAQRAQAEAKQYMSSFGPSSKLSRFLETMH